VTHTVSPAISPLKSLIVPDCSTTQKKKEKKSVRNKQTISAPEESVLETICCSNKTVHYKQTVCAPEESVLETIGCSNKTVHDKQTISAAEQTNLCNTNKQICAPTNLFIYKQSVASTKL
jgi:hypothetical protein